MNHAIAPPLKTINDMRFPMIKPTEINAGDNDIPNANNVLER